MQECVNHNETFIKNTGRKNCLENVGQDSSIESTTIAVFYGSFCHRLSTNYTYMIKISTCVHIKHSYSFIQQLL